MKVEFNLRCPVCGGEVEDVATSPDHARRLRMTACCVDRSCRVQVLVSIAVDPVSLDGRFDPAGYAAKRRAAERSRQVRWAT